MRPKTPAPWSRLQVAHPAVRRVNFTGRRAWAASSARPAKYLKPVILELGGKAPFLVLTMPTSTCCRLLVPLALLPTRPDMACPPSASSWTRPWPRNLHHCAGGPRPDFASGRLLARGPVVLGSVVDMNTVNRASTSLHRDDAASKRVPGILCGGKRQRHLLMAATLIRRRDSRRCESP